MILLQLLIENETLEKSRKSLFSASIIVLFFASLHITSGELNFFGIKASIQPERILVFSRLIVAYLLFTFCLRLFPTISEWGLRRQIERHRQWSEAGNRAFGPGPEYDPDDFMDPSLEEFINNRKLKENILEKRKTSAQKISTVVPIFLNYVLPINFAIVAIVNPSTLSFFWRGA